ncbi:cytokine receptor-like factor 2 [Mantella aurantiaca]
MFHMDRLVLTIFLLFNTLLTDGVQADINKFNGAPKNMTLRWEDNEMTIQSAWEEFGQQFDDFCFALVLQLKTKNTSQWQISKRSSECTTINYSIECYFSNLDLDAEKCYEMQAQFQVLESCLTSTPKSQWSNAVFMKNGSLYDLCPEVATNSQPTTMEMQRLVIILFSTVVAVVFILLIFIGCFMKRVKKCVFPIIPDPKNAFYDLYDGHNRYIQEWMKVSRNDAQLEEINSVLDEQDEDPVLTFLKDNAAVILDNQCLTEETMDAATTTSEPLVEGISDSCFRNMNFTMNDSMYIML